MREDLKSIFGNLSADEKITFLQSIMPEVCTLFSENPQRMMAEMMPLCRQMMEGCGMDMAQMMTMMQAMKSKSCGCTDTLGGKCCG
ncbi:hypothetical protein [Chrysiogenes arsenatis]|uniref:hypothetical protein n=1 Tax=Chrysiogenes arsenatis TaxID=309797 RepID=UPI0004196094|nr:hypothetical protein [Chrysiogenes arsenatis]